MQDFKPLLVPLSLKGALSQSSRLLTLEIAMLLGLHLRMRNLQLNYSISCNLGGIPCKCLTMLLGSSHLKCTPCFGKFLYVDHRTTLLNVSSATHFRCQAVSKRPSIEDLLKHPWIGEHMHAQIARAESLQAKKRALMGPASVSITVDCTVGNGNASSSCKGSSSSSADSAETTEVQRSV